MIHNVSLTRFAAPTAATRSTPAAGPGSGQAAPADGASISAPPLLETPKDAVKTLCTGFGYVEFPQVSPDGKHLVFNVVGDYTTSQMFVMKAKGGKVRSLFTREEVTADTVKAFLTRHQDHIDEQGTWSRDGESLFFRTNRQGTFGLARFDFEQGGDRLLVHDPKLNMKHPVETEDGYLVAYGGPPSDKYATVDKYTDVFLVDPEGGKVTMLTRSDGTVSYKHPSEMDGKILAHKETGTEEHQSADIVLIDPRTGEETKITDTPEVIERHPFYNEKRDLLAFHSDETGDKNVWIAEPDGSRRCQLTFYGKAAQSPSWSPDGKKLYFIKKDVRQAEGEPFYARQTGIRVLDVKDALEDLAEQARRQVKGLKMANAPEEQIEAARRRRDDYEHFLKRYD